MNQTPKIIKNKGNQYFTKEVQDAILEYVATDSPKRKNELYINIIGPKLKELIDNVVQVYRLGTLPNISFQKEECLLYIISVLGKFDAEKISKRTNTPSKAFTYFTVVSKHWFFASFKRNKKRKYEEINIDDLVKSGNTNDFNACHTGLSGEISNEIVVHNEYDEEREKQEFRIALLTEIENWKEQYKDDEDVFKTITALSYLIENIGDVEFFTKKGLFVYLRELSGLETKQISASIRKITSLFKDFKTRWENGKI